MYNIILIGKTEKLLTYAKNCYPFMEFSNMTQYTNDDVKAVFNKEGRYLYHSCPDIREGAFKRLPEEKQIQKLSLYYDNVGETPEERLQQFRKINDE